MNPVKILYKLIERGRKGQNIGISTGLPKLDKYVGGVQKGIYTLLFGGSGAGKSTYALYCYIYRPLKDNPNADIKIIYDSLEMSAEILLAKLLCMYIYEEYGCIIPYSDLLSWTDILGDEPYEYVLKGEQWLKSIVDKNLIIYDKSLNASRFYKTSMELLEQWGEFIESEDGRRKIYIKRNPQQIILRIVDHLGLVTPAEGRNKKDEMDLVSAYAVTLREKCNMSFLILQQENRNAADMDRRKADMSEPSAEDLKQTGNTYNDCDVCIGIYNPLKHKIKTYRGFKIIIENATNAFIGLRDRYRSLVIIKNRYGQSDKIISTNFFGEISYIREIECKGEDIIDYTPYLSLKNQKEQEKVKDTEEIQFDFSNFKF